MIIGHAHRSYPTVHIPPYETPENTTANIHSLLDDYDINMDMFTCDHFRLYVFKVKKCERARSHDWTECPYVHPGEKARRRDPRKFCYSGNACPDYRKGECVRGDACEYSHGVFECWLHPTRYRTQPCKDGVLCRRKICFFAHTSNQLRLLHESPSRFGDDSVMQKLYGSPSSPLYYESPSRLGGNSVMQKLYGSSPTRLSGDSVMQKLYGLSPTSPLYMQDQNESPPMSPNSVSELGELLRDLHVGKCSRLNINNISMSQRCGFGPGQQCYEITPGFSSVSVTPTGKMTRSGLGEFDMWGESGEEELVMERVESGRDVRAKMYAKLSKENSLDRVDSLWSGEVKTNKLKTTDCGSFGLMG